MSALCIGSRCPAQASTCSTGTDRDSASLWHDCGDGFCPPLSHRLSVDGLMPVSLANRLSDEPRCLKISCMYVDIYCMCLLYRPRNKIVNTAILLYLYMLVAEELPPKYKAMDSILVSSPLSLPPCLLVVRPSIFALNSFYNREPPLYLSLLQMINDRPRQVHPQLEVTKIQRISCNIEAKVSVCRWPIGSR